MIHVSDEILNGLLASARNKKADLFLENFDEMNKNKCLRDILNALLDDCAENSPHQEEAQAGVALGMVYTYMLFKAQIESDEISKQWGRHPYGN